MSDMWHTKHKHAIHQPTITTELRVSDYVCMPAYNTITYSLVFFQSNAIKTTAVSKLCHQLLRMLYMSAWRQEFCHSFPHQMLQIRLDIPFVCFVVVNVIQIYQLTNVCIIVINTQLLLVWHVLWMLRVRIPHNAGACWVEFW